MANFKRIPVLVDAASGKQIDEFGAVVRDNDFFRLLFDETVILCCQLYDLSWIDGEAQLSEHLIDSDLTLEAFGDNDFDSSTSFMFLSEQTEDVNNKVNIANDWFDGSTANPANGQLSFRINTNTVRFAEALESSSLQKFYFCVTGVPSGQSAKTVLAYFRFKAENRPSSSVGIPVSSDPEYLTAQEVQALVKVAPVFEFSVDGTTLWHSVQVVADLYYREQRNGGDWSDAIEMIPGATGATGPTGVSGPTGAPGADGTDGTGYNDQGDYSAAVTYAAQDTVTYVGSLFFSLADTNLGNVPSSSPAHWRLLVSTGNDGADGTDGINGTNGTDGTDGNTWLFTTGAPSAGLGIDGDSALDTINMNVYLKVAGTWDFQGAIKGDTGADGTGITPKGIWSSVTNYVENDAVSYEGSLWRAIQASTNEAPPSLPTTSNTYWDTLVEIGTAGATGASGPAGADGTDAPQLQFEYSINGSTLWHTTFATGDLYLRSSVDDGISWTDSMKFIGVDGSGITEAQAIEIALIY